MPDIKMNEEEEQQEQQGLRTSNMKINEEEEEEEEEENNQEYDSIPFTEDPICYSIDPTFCKLTFDLKHALYSETILTGDEKSDSQQDLKLLNQYTLFLDIIHRLLYGLFTKENSPDNPVPKQIIGSLPPESKKALDRLYPTICEAIKKNQRDNNNENNYIYGLFIHRMLHTHPFEMRTDEPERD